MRIKTLVTMKKNVLLNFISDSVLADKCTTTYDEKVEQNLPNNKFFFFKSSGIF
jgi:hypothetical protein